MSVAVDIVTQQVEDALLVPVRAIQGRRNKQTITVLEGEEQVSRPIVVGDRNDKFVVVLEGVRQGETVVIPKTTAGALRGRRIGGGGLGGGGGRSR